MAQHRVIVHKWHSGKLNVIERFFDAFDDALSFSRTHADSHIKIYDAEDQLVHQCTNRPEDESAY